MQLGAYLTVVLTELEKQTASRTDIIAKYIAWLIGWKWPEVTFSSNGAEFIADGELIQVMSIDKEKGLGKNQLLTNKKNNENRRF